MWFPHNREQQLLFEATARLASVRLINRPNGYALKFFILGCSSTNDITYYEIFHTVEKNHSLAVIRYRLQTYPTREKHWMQCCNGQLLSKFIINSRTLHKNRPWLEQWELTNKGNCRHMLNKRVVKNWLHEILLQKWSISGYLYDKE